MGSGTIDIIISVGIDQKVKSKKLIKIGKANRC